jgi:hypothetical protein
MTPKRFYPVISNMGIKNEEFDADLESIEKVAKKLTWRKLEG